MTVGIGASVSEWLDMMPSTVLIAPWASRTVTDMPSYGADVPYKCHIQLKNHMVVNAKGEEVLARGRVFVGSAVLASVKDRLTLPAGYVPLVPPILAVNVVTDELGVHHTTIEIG